MSNENKTSRRSAAFGDIEMARIAFTPIPDLSTFIHARERPQYSLAEIAYYLDIPKPTLHAWSRATKLGGKVIEPLIVAADPIHALYSFYNLTEAHILSMTKSHGVKTINVRRAMQTFREVSLHDIPHPLLSEEFSTDGKHLWLKKLENRIDLSQYGQLGLAPILDEYLERIVRDDLKRPTKFFPMKQEGKFVSITSFVSSGRPILDGTGIPVSTIWNRYLAGDTIEFLADDFEVSEDQIKGAFSYVEQHAAIS